MYSNLTRFIITILLSVFCTGCLLHTNKVAVIDIDDASYPLLPQIYYIMTYSYLGTGHQDKEFFDSHASKTERKIIMSDELVPDLNQPFRISRVGNCYSFQEISKNNKKLLYLLFERIEGDVYIANMLDKCVNKGVSASSTVRFVTVIDNEISNLAFLGIDGGARESKLDEKFQDWALGLGKYSKWLHGITIIKDKDNTDHPQVDSTSAYKAFYKEHKNSFNTGVIATTGQSNNKKYSNVTNLKARLTKEYIEFKAEEKSKKETLKRQKVAEDKRKQDLELAAKRRIKKLGLVETAPGPPSDYTGMFIVYKSGSIDQMTSNNKGVNFRDTTEYGLNWIYLEHNRDRSFELIHYFSDLDIQGFHRKNRKWRNCKNMWMPPIKYELEPMRDTTSGLYFKDIWRMKQKTLACHEITLNSPSNGYNCEVRCRKYKQSNDQTQNNLILTRSNSLAIQHSNNFQKIANK
jgi:hypothetical protein